MINKIDTTSGASLIAAQTTKKKIKKHTKYAVGGAVAGVVYAFIPREASPVAHRAGGRKLALAGRLKRPEPFRYGTIGAAIALGFSVITDLIKSKKKKNHKSIH